MVLEAAGTAADPCFRRRLVDGPGPRAGGAARNQSCHHDDGRRNSQPG